PLSPKGADAAKPPHSRKPAIFFACKSLILRTIREFFADGGTMAYEKKLCILKQIGKGFTADGMPLMGAVYAERLGSDLTLTPRIAGLAPLHEGRYALAVVVGRKEYCLELKGNTA